MADDLNRLLIKIEADTSKLRSALNDAQSGVERATQGMQRSLDRHSASVKKWSASLTSEFKKIVAGYVGIELARKAVAAIDEVGSLKDSAAAAGLTTVKFQELAFAAKQSGASVDDLSRGLDKFAVNMAQVRLNTGAFNQFLKDQAPALRASLAATKTQGQAIDVLSNFMAGLGDEGERATVAQAAFGRSGTELISVLDKGAASLANSAAEAHKYGLVMGDELSDAAEKTKKQLALLEDQIANLWRGAVITTAKGVADIAAAMKSAFQNHNFELFGDKDFLGINSALDLALGKVPTGAPGVPGAVNPNGLDSGLLGGLSAQAGKLPAIVPAQHLRPKPNYAGGDQIAALNKQVLESQGELQKALQASYDQELTQFQRMLDNKEITEAQFATARKDLGAIMLEQTRQNLGAETQLQKDYYSAIRDNMDSTFMDAFSTALETGRFKAADFFNSLLQGFAKITTEVLVLKPLLNSLFAGSPGSSSTSGLGSFLNGILGSVGGSANGWAATVTPARAAGGPGSKGQPYLTGEHGPEIFTPNANGRFLSAGATASMGSTIYNQNIDARGADIGAAQRIERALAASRQPNPVASVKQAQKRFPTR